MSNYFSSAQIVHFLNRFLRANVSWQLGIFVIFVLKFQAFQVGPCGQTKPGSYCPQPQVPRGWVHVAGWKFVSMSLEIYGSEFYLAKQADAWTDSHTRHCERFGLIVLLGNHSIVRSTVLYMCVHNPVSQYGRETATLSLVEKIMVFTRLSFLVIAMLSPLIGCVYPPGIRKGLDRRSSGVLT
jgi:hypothetical protein